MPATRVAFIGGEAVREAFQRFVSSGKGKKRTADFQAVSGTSYEFKGKVTYTQAPKPFIVEVHAVWVESREHLGAFNPNWVVAAKMVPTQSRYLRVWFRRDRTMAAALGFDAKKVSVVAICVAEGDASSEQVHEATPRGSRLAADHVRAYICPRPRRVYVR